MSAVKEVESIKKILESGKYSWTDLQRFCSLVKIGNHRFSGLVLKYGSELLDTRFSSLKTQEAWDLVEQVIISALDSGDFDAANKYMKWLDNKFPNSNRVLRLKGMKYEAERDYHKAVQSYDAILKSDPGNAITLKRRIAVEISLGTKKKAITMLNEYLAIYMDDTEAWLELANIYLKDQLYEYAAFCFEELILLEPHNYHYYYKYAEIKYTLEEYELALKYYALSLDLCRENNLASFYGIIMTTNKISKLSKEEKELQSWAQSEILQIYKKDEKLEIVKSSIGQISVNDYKESSPLPKAEPKQPKKEEPVESKQTGKKPTAVPPKKPVGATRKNKK